MNPPTRRAILNRLMRLVSHMVRNLESEMKKEGATVGDKETAVLGQLVASMGKLIALETEEAGIKHAKQNSELLDIRDKLVRRIDELKRK
jgi:hypothetical protein